jgi:hypothetical protein
LPFELPPFRFVEAVIEKRSNSQREGKCKRHSRPNLLKDMESSGRELAKIVKAVKTFGILVNLVIAGTLAELEFRFIDH